MENLSNLVPTDNLYRFLSIAGMLIFGFCFFYPDYRIYQINQREINLTGEGDLLDIKIKASGEKIDKYNKEMKKIVEGSSPDFNTINKISKMNIEKMSPKEIVIYKSRLIKAGNKLKKSSKEIDRINKLIEEQAKMPDSLRMANTRLKTVNNLINNDLQRVNKLSRIAVIGQVVGILMTLTGFFCWYFFMQLPQDRILKYQIDELKNRGQSSATP